MKLLQTIDKLNAYLDMKLKEGKDPVPENHLNDDLLMNIAAVEKTSNKIISWSLSLLGGSFLAILSDEFVHPELKLFKLGYLIFVPGWVFTMISINYGLQISGLLSAAHRNQSKLTLLEDGFDECQKYSKRQIRCFKTALFLFSLWLLAYLTWWIFTDLPIKKLINL